MRQAASKQVITGLLAPPKRAPKPGIDARPSALLRAWRCLSAALFAGALASPVAAELHIPEVGDKRVSVQLRQSSGGGSSTHKYYLGLGGGVSRVEPTGVGSGFSADDVQSEGAKVFFGKYFSPQWRWEIGYTDAGESGLKDPAGAADDKPKVSHKVPSIAIDYLFRKPSSKLNFYLRGGAALNQYESDDSRIQFEDESEVGALVGAGMQWKIGDRVEARLGVESYGKSTAFASLSLATRLGSSKNGYREMAVGGEPVAAENVDIQHETQAASDNSVAQQSDAADAQSAHGALCKSVDREINGVSFDSGSAVLSVGAKRQLDRVATALKRGPNIRVTVRGYTDSRGNARKNQLLSQKRAEAVGRYLMMAIGNFNNPPRAVGMGESNPVASNDTASGRSKNRRIELNMRAGEGCEASAIDEEAGNKAVQPDNATTQGQVPAAAALDVPEVVPGSSISASYGSEKPACQVINQVVKGLRFDLGDHLLSRHSERALMPILAALRNDSSLRVQVKGHTDSVGKRAENQKLSELRAKSVANYLMIQAPQTAVAVSYLGEGEMSPIQSNSTPAGREANRRIEVALTGGRNCHLPTQHAGNIFAPTNPVAKRRFVEEPQIKPQLKKPLAAVAVPSTAVAGAVENTTMQLAQTAEQAIVDQSNDIDVLPQAVSGLAQEEAEGLQQLVVTEDALEPAPQMLEQGADSSTVVGMVSPIAEPASSESAGFARSARKVSNSNSCDSLDRVISGVQFDSGETVLDQRARGVLDTVAQLLSRDPGINIVIEGHTDNVGSAQENMALSERRAKTVAAYLAGAAGMVRNPPQAIGYGEIKPMYRNDTAKGRRANRRIVLKLDAGKACLSGDVLAAIPELQTEAVVLATSAVIARPQAAALRESAPAVVSTSTETFDAAMGRLSRGFDACGKVAHVVEAVDFQPGDHRLDMDDQRALMPLVTLWRKSPDLDIEIMGHTDDVGSAAGNRRLSQRRAQSVAQFLMFEAGLVENVPTATGFGESRPRANNNSAEGRQLNRRIEVLVKGGEQCEGQAAVAPAAVAPVASFSSPEYIEPQIAQLAPIEAEVVEAEVIELAQAQIEEPLPVQEVAQIQMASGGGSAASEALLGCGETELIRTGVEFGTGAYFLNDHSRKMLSPVVGLLRADPEMQVEVQGHTDDIGTAKRNLTLSERRAEAVAQYLMHATDNVDNPPVAVGYGADVPLVDNNDAEGRAQNRRIDILLSAGQSCQQAAQTTELDVTEQHASNVWALPAIQFAQLGEQTVPEPQQCVAIQRVVQKLNFEPAGFRLDALAKNALAPVIAELRKDPGIFIEVYGHSGDYGNRDFDHVLAERRAEAVADYLMVETGNFDNLPVAVGFADLAQDMVADINSPLYRANRIELRLSKGAACEQAVTGDINIRRPIERLSSAESATESEVQMGQGGGGEKPATAALLATKDSCDSHSRILDSVAFDAGSYHLNGPSKKALDQVAEALLLNPGLRYEIHGHTDAIGDERANLALSEWRARSVADYLSRATGEWPHVAYAEGFGESRPLASNDSKPGRLFNRRIELKLIDYNCK